MNSSRGLAGIAALSGTYCALAVLVPVTLVLLSASSAEEGTLGIPLLMQVTLRLLLVGTLTGLLATAAGWWIARSVPPALVIAAALVSPMSRSLGWLALGIRPGLVAFALAQFSVLTPMAAVIIMMRAHTLPAQPLQAARELGASRLQRCWRISWPHLRPALLLAFAWCVLQVVGDVVVADLAGGGKIYGPAVIARDALIRDAAPMRARVVIVAMLVVALLLASAVRRELDVFDTRLDDRHEQAPVDRDVAVLGWAAFLITLVPLLALLPAAVGLMPTTSSTALARLLPVTLILAIGLGLCVALLGSLVAGAQTEQRFQSDAHTRTNMSNWLLVPLVVPSSVLGSAWLSAAPSLSLRPGFLLTALALSAPLVSLSTLAARLSLRRISRMEWDAARDLGAGLVARARYLAGPIVVPMLVILAALGFAWVLAQDAIPAYTGGPGGTTVAMGLANTAKRGDVATLHRWLIVLSTAPSLVLLLALARGRSGAFHSAWAADNSSTPRGAT